MFIRTKSRKNKAGKIKTYAYLVENKYRKRGKYPRQKAKKYLGRVFTFKKSKDDSLDFSSSFIDKESFKTLVRSLIGQELKNYGFRREGDIWENEDITVDLKNGVVLDSKTKKDVCIALNNGFLTQYTIKKVIEFKPPEGLEREIGKALGHTIVSAGIPVDHELFIALFRKVMTNLDRQQQ